MLRPDVMRLYETKTQLDKETSREDFVKQQKEKLNVDELLALSN